MLFEQTVAPEEDLVTLPAMAGAEEFGVSGRQARSPAGGECGHGDVQEVRCAKAQLASFLFAVPFRAGPRGRGCGCRRGGGGDGTARGIGRGITEVARLVLRAFD
ncbi:hypothetical protein [Streptomyces sp. NPDC087538]|uniref:hypothetical protein n=1 Tax=Streptomyces sp. NPDC087538 TaxID=3365797 RepID=UPI0038038830